MSLAGTYYNFTTENTMEVLETVVEKLPFKPVRKVYYRFNNEKNWQQITPSVLARHIETLNYKKIPDKELYEDLLWE